MIGNQPIEYKEIPVGTSTPAGNWICTASGGIQKCWNWSLPYDASKRYNKLIDFCTIAINQIEGTNSYELINKYLPTGVMKYTSDAELNAVFDNAYTNGEPTGNIRDRTMLHMVIYICTALTDVMPGLGGFDFPINGRVSWTSDIMTDTGKTANEVISLGYKIAKNFLIPKQYQGIVQVDLPTAFTYINSILPSKFNKYYIPSGSLAYDSPGGLELANQDSSLHPENSNRWPWLCRVSAIGQVYVAYLAKEKWKLDMNWVPPGFPLLDAVTKQYINSIYGSSTNLTFTSLNFTS
jgi:hypothetical protein